MHAIPNASFPERSIAVSIKQQASAPAPREQRRVCRAATSVRRAASAQKFAKISIASLKRHELSVSARRASAPAPKEQRRAATSALRNFAQRQHNSAPRRDERAQKFRAAPRRARSEISRRAASSALSNFPTISSNSVIFPGNSTGLGEGSKIGLDSSGECAGQRRARRIVSAQ